MNRVVEGRLGLPVDLPSGQMRNVDAMLRKLAPSAAPVAILGESGVGKEVAAARLHALSGRPGAFVPINAAAMSPGLVASELFGHVRGAFTGATEDRDGAFQSAHGGTLFLDEIADLAQEAQALLLRAVDQGCVSRVGEVRQRKVDARLVSASNCDLAERVRKRCFRQDLYHRISVVTVVIPPLRERAEDLEVLARAFLARQQVPRRLSRQAWVMLRKHAWPGNVRELFNVLERGCLLADKELLTPRELDLVDAEPKAEVMFERIHELVIEAFLSNDRDVAQTARRLGLRRSTVYEHLRRGSQLANRGKRAEFGCREPAGVERR